MARSQVVTMQWEVAQRLIAKPRSKEYGILSVVFQLYCKPNATRPRLLSTVPAVSRACV